MQVPGIIREGGCLGFKTYLARSTVPSQCDLECGPKVIPWKDLRADPGDHRERGPSGAQHCSEHCSEPV